MRYNAKKEHWNGLEILGVEGIFTDLRIERSSVPKNLYFYELRDDCSDGIPCQYKSGILVDFFGTFISKEPLPDDNDGFFSEDDWTYTDLYNTTLADFVIGENRDFYRIYTENSHKYIQFNGYIYCAGDSVTSNPDEIWRKVNIENKNYILLDTFLDNKRNVYDEVTESARQYIADRTAAVIIDDAENWFEDHNATELELSDVTSETPDGYYFSNCNTF